MGRPGHQREVAVDYVSSNLVQRGVGAAAIYAVAQSTVTVMNSRFTPASHGAGAAAVYTSDSTATMDRIHVTECAASNDLGVPALSGGHSAVIVAAAQAEIAIDRAVFDANSDDVILVDQSQAAIDHSSFINGLSGAAVVATGASTITVSNTQISSNLMAATALSRATISLFGGSTATIAACSFTGNVVSDGSLSEPTAGAVFATNAGTSVAVDIAAFSSNHGTALTAGAGSIYLSDAAALTASGCTFAGNTGSAPVSAGAVLAESASVMLDSTTFTNNRAASHPVAGTSAGGGAIYTTQSAVRCSNCTVEDNVARDIGEAQQSRPTYSDAFFVYEPTDVKFLDTVYNPILDGSQTVAINPGNVDGKPAGGYEQHPCAPGESCIFERFSITCTACPENQQSSDGLTCSLCAPGEGATEAQDGCEPCGPNMASPFGICSECPGIQVVSPDRDSCLDCPVAQAAVDGAAGSDRQCDCASGYLNATASYMVCFDVRGYDESYDERSFADYTEGLSVTGNCQQCATDNDGQACVDCSAVGGAGFLAAGFTVPQLPGRRMLQTGGTAQVAFRCHQEWDLATARCPANPSAPGMCAEGYTGFLCQSCADGYGMTPSRVCETCEDTGLTGMSFVIMAIIIVVLTLIGFVVSKYWPQMPGKHLVRCAFVPVRIMVTYAQVVSQLGEVLSFPYPPLFNSVVNVIRPIIDVWGVLFRC